MKEVELRKILDDFRNQAAETECVEFKEAKQDYDFTKLGRYFSALSNEANLKGKDFAWLIFGVKDKPVPRPVVGSNYRASSRPKLDSLKAEIANKTTNRITFTEIYELNYPEGRVVIFQIPAAPRGFPIAFEGHYYGRDGEEIGALNIVEVETIRKQVVHLDWSAKIVPEATINDLDGEAIVKAREEYKKKNPSKVNDCDKWDDVTFLNKAKVTIQGKITNTALLLLGKEESVHFLKPAIAKISWILKDDNNREIDYEHFGTPFILNTSKLFNKIRNLTYRYLDDTSLFPTEIKTYEPYVIREALHNCIAHQDYSLQSRITVVERPDELIFTNAGSFLPGSIDTVIEQDSPQEFYRNNYLADAMVNLNMIDTIGSGIKRMFEEQRNRFFPLPDFDLSDSNKVIVRVSGRIWDENYTKLLMSQTDLDLKTVILLDRVQKSLPIEDSELAFLKKQGLVEGRKPNIHITASIAQATGDRSSYIKMRGFKDEHYKKMVLEYLDKYGNASKQDIDNLILDILPNVLNKEQKENKVRNLIYSMSKRDSTIINKGNNRNPIWVRIKNNSKEK